MNRVLFYRDEVEADGTVRLTGVRARHVIEVLHADAGQKLRVGVIDGVTGEGTVVSATKSQVVLQCVLNGRIPPVPAVDLLLAMPRPKVMKRLWAQLAAVGVGHVVVANAAKVERNYFDTQWLEKEHYVPLLVEGLMQAADTRLPQVTICRRLKPFVEDEMDELFAGGSRYVFHPGGKTALQAMHDGKKGRMLIAVGPEGGWTEFELDLLKAHGFICAGMGERILRSDTACIAALTLAHAISD